MIAITGPTTSGKTELSLRLAERLDGEVISMDSRQIYRGMDIGTDKVSVADRARIRHYGLDIRDPDESYSAGAFARDARRWIEEIRSRGRRPILAGGTGFFLRALVEPLFREPELDAEARLRLRDWLRRLDPETLRRWAIRLDPTRTAALASGGRQRSGRSVEVALLTGRPLGWWHRHSLPADDPLPLDVFVLHLPREELDARIDARVDAMLRRGLVAEVRGLLEQGYTVEDPGMSGTGYREIAAYLGGRATLEEAADEIRRVTRGYARRQSTWFRNQLDPEEVTVLDARLPTEDLVSAVSMRVRGRTPRLDGSPR